MLLFSSYLKESTGNDVINTSTHQHKRGGFLPTLEGSNVLELNQKRSGLLCLPMEYLSFLKFSASAPLPRSSTATVAPGGKSTTLCHCCFPKSTPSKTRLAGSKAAGGSIFLAGACSRLLSLFFVFLLYGAITCEIKTLR